MGSSRILPSSLTAGYISLTEAAKMLHGRKGQCAHVQTLRRWANKSKGCRPIGAAGPVIYLRVVRMNGDMLTRMEWVEEFERERLRIGEQSVQPEPPVVVSSRARQASIKRANKVLEAAGIK